MNMRLSNKEIYYIMIKLATIVLAIMFLLVGNFALGLLFLLLVIWDIFNFIRDYREHKKNGA